MSSRTRTGTTSSSNRRSANAGEWLYFFEQSFRLKSQPRRGWKRTGVAKPESVADHSFGTALLALALTPKGLNKQSTLELALVHDLAEALMGDPLPGELSRQEKRRKEAKAIEAMTRKLPVTVRKKFLSLLTEYQQAKTRESRFVHELDKLEMAIQGKRYGKPEFVRSVKNRLKTRVLRAIWRKLNES